MVSQGKQSAQPSMWRSSMLLLCASVPHVLADVYMHHPAGSNNRLARGDGNRENNNRLFDSQNNNKGGYGYGGSNTVKAPPLKFIAGSKLSVAFTAQHSCGAENNECQLVLQYMCNDGRSTPKGLPPVADGIGEGPVRDGIETASPNPNDPQDERGLHEPTSFYQACSARERNKGLYIADRKLNGNNAKRTRQNNNGDRSGLECPEERDYYPYWHPTPWRDLAIMTNNVPLCEYYASESQNVKPKNFCTEAQANNEEACAAAEGSWEAVEPFKLPPPTCIAAPFQRDNHLGNGPGEGSNEVYINITIPSGAGHNGSDVADACVLRLRYNITTGDTRACNDTSFTNRTECEAAGQIWSAAFLDASYNAKDREDNASPHLPDQDPRVTLDGFLSGGGGADSQLALAINTDQFGRTFEDRSHLFSIQEWPADVPANVDIYNLNVKGKRGNIVQTYPATEYDYHPVSLEVGHADYIHFQWTGNDNTNNNGNNNGEGTDGTDRHNIVQIGDHGLNLPLSADAADMFDVEAEVNLETDPAFAGPRTREELVRQFALVKQTDCATAEAVENSNDRDQMASNCEKLNRADATVDLGLLRMRPGTYKYMSTRNNNFSNRGQKGKITVLNSNSIPPQPPTDVQALVVREGANAAVHVVWRPSGSDPYIATNGQTVVGRNEQLHRAHDYRLEYSADAGREWKTVKQCVGSISASPECALDGLTCSCKVEHLSAGTTYAFHVLAGGRGGWSPPSAVAIAATDHTSESRKYADKLQANAQGEGLSGGAIAGIVFGVIGGLLLIAFGIFLYRRRQPPPPPPLGIPEAKFKGMPPQTSDF